MAVAGLPDTAVVFPGVAAFADAFRLMVRHRHTQVTGRRPPYPALLSASALRLAAVDADSCSVTLEIAGPIPLGKLADAPRDGLVALLAGAADFHSLPAAVAFPLRQIASGLPDGINSVVIAGSAGLSAPALKLTREMFDAGPPQRETFCCHGRLQEINWSSGTAVLNSPIDKCLLVFPQSLAEKMRAAGNRHISVAGIGERTADGIIIIREIASITVNDDNVGGTEDLAPSEDDVQQALAVIRWQEKQREWFYDDELDAFVDAILERKHK